MKIMPNIKIKKRKTTKIAYIEHTGNYSTIPYDQDISKLYSFAKKNKLRPGFKPFALYPDDPNSGPWENTRTRVAITINKLSDAFDNIQTSELPQMEVACMKFKGSSEAYQEGYNKLWQWIKENGYKLNGSPMEFWGKKPKIKNGVAIISSEIQAPIIKINN